MSTRSAIIMKTPEGFTGIYCHFDGYPSGVGAILEKHYDTPEKVAELIALSDLSALREKVKPAPGQKHSFDAPLDDVTIAYHRDRGEDFHQAKGATAAQVGRMIDNNGYVHVFDGKWTCNGTDLAEAVKNDN